MRKHMDYAKLIEKQLERLTPREPTIKLWLEEIDLFVAAVNDNPNLDAIFEEEEPVGNIRSFYLTLFSEIETSFKVTILNNAIFKISLSKNSIESLSELQEVLVKFIEDLPLEI